MNGNVPVDGEVAGLGGLPCVLQHGVLQPADHCCKNKLTNPNLIGVKESLIVLGGGGGGKFSHVFVIDICFLNIVITMRKQTLFT